MSDTELDGRIPVVIISPDGLAAETTREVGARLLDKPQVTLMVKPLSPTGQAPATHWLCENRFAPEVFAKMMAYPKRHGTEVIDGRTATTEEILEERGLKVISHDRRPLETAAAPESAV